MKEYAQYVDCVRKYKKTLSVNEAVDCAVEECIQQGILESFLRANKAEVKSMSIFEYDEEAVKKLWKQEFYEDGRADGLAEGLERGRVEGAEKGELQGIAITKKVFALAGQKLSTKEIAERLDISEEKVRQILE